MYTDFTAIMGTTGNPGHSLGSGTGSPAALKHAHAFSPDTTILALKSDGCFAGGFVHPAQTLSMLGMDGFGLPDGFLDELHVLPDLVRDTEADGLPGLLAGAVKDIRLPWHSDAPQSFCGVNCKTGCFPLSLA